MKTTTRVRPDRGEATRAGEVRMKVSDIMTREVEVLSPEATLQDAARRMKELDVGSLPVCDGERLVGMLTDRDIVVRAVAEARDGRETRVRDVMSAEVRYVFEDQDVDEGAELMEEHQIRRLPALDRNKRLVGIISIGDIAVRTSDDALSGAALEGVSEPTAR
jgi:CBS domain-containing protein